MESQAANAVIEGEIEARQQEYLCAMLGTKLGAKVGAYLAAKEEDESTERNIVYDDICYMLEYAFADYVYYWLLRDTTSVATIDGLVALKISNDRVSPARKMTEAWNRMVGKNRVFAIWADACGLDVDTERNMLTPINTINL